MQLHRTCLPLLLLMGCEAPTEPTSTSSAAPEQVVTAPEPSPQPVHHELRPITRRQATPPQLQPFKPLPPETLQKLAKYSQQGSVSFDALDATERAALKSSCPALTELAAELGGELIGSVVDGTKAELPVQILIGAGKIVVKHEQDAICEFVDEKAAGQ